MGDVFKVAKKIVKIKNLLIREATKKTSRFSQKKPTTTQQQQHYINE